MTEGLTPGKSESHLDEAISGSAVHEAGLADRPRGGRDVVELERGQSLAAAASSRHDDDLIIGTHVILKNLIFIRIKVH